MIMTYIVIQVGLILLYIFVIRPKIKQYRAISGVIDNIDAEGISLWTRLNARFSGLKTVILGTAAAIFPQVPAILEEINNFTGWNLFMTQETAGKVTAVLAAATAITHVYGLVSAAKVVPIPTAPIPPINM